MTPLVWAAVVLAAGARAGSLVRVDFVGGAVVRPNPTVSAWAPALSTLFAPGAPRADWPPALQAVARLDWNDPANAKAFLPLIEQLSRGMDPVAAARAAVEARTAEIRTAGDLAESALQSGAEPAARAAVGLLRLQEDSGPWLDAKERARGDRLYRAAVALQTEARAKRAIERLRGDAAALSAEDPLEAALARDPEEPVSDEKRERAKLVKFDPSRRRASEPPKISLRPGQDPGSVIQGLSLGLSPGEASKLGFGKPADDFYGRYPSALSAARLEAASRGLTEAEVQLVSAQTPLGREDWSFVFFARNGASGRFGHLVDVTFAPASRGAMPMPRARVATRNLLPQSELAFGLSAHNVGRAFRFSAAEARRFAGEAVPPAEVGLSVVVEPVEVPETGELDFWYRFVDGSGREYARVNAASGRVAGPPAPRARAEGGPLARLLGWLKGLL